MERPRSLDQYFGLTPNGIVLSKDVKSLLVEHAIGDAGWWYKKNEIDTGGFSPKFVINKKESLFATVFKDAACIWDFEGTKRVLLQHAAEVNDVAFHPNDNTVMTVSDDGNATLWDVTGIKLHRFPHEMSLNSILWNSSGNFFATVRRDRVFVWRHGEHQRTLRADSCVPTAAFHPHRNTIAVLLGSCLWLRDLDTDDEKLLTHKMKATAVTFQPQGNYVAIAESQTRQAVVWDLKDDSKVELPHASALCSIVFNPAGNLLATTCGDTGSLWSLKGEKRCTMRHKDIVGSICVSPQGSLVATGSHDNSACFWDLHGNKKMTFSYDTWAMETAFIADGTQFAVMTFEGRVVIYQKHTQPTFAQILMRRVLKNYFQQCIGNQVAPEICALQEEMPLWMAKKFNLQEEELRLTWQSMPEKLRKSIFNTLLFRGQEIKEMHAKYKAEEHQLAFDVC